MGKKAVFFDIDGTLYDFRTGVCESTREALKRLRENGHYAFICTGRTKTTVFDPGLLSLGFDGIVAGCGTYVELYGEKLLNYEIPHEILMESLAVFRDHGMDPVLEGPENLYYCREEYLVGKHDEFMMALDRKIPERLLEIEGNQDNLHVNKLCVRCEDEELCGKGLKLLDKYYTAVHSEQYHWELIPAGYSKATGMEVVCSRLDIGHNDVYAFGDSANDLDMLRAAGCGIAMGNACQIARETADYVTRPIDEDGIYLGLKEFSLI